MTNSTNDLVWMAERERIFELAGEIAANCARRRAKRIAWRSAASLKAAATLRRRIMDECPLMAQFGRPSATCSLLRSSPQERSRRLRRFDQAQRGGSHA